MMGPPFLPLDTLDAEKYSIVLDYPRADLDSTLHTINVLSGMGINGISFTGRVQIRDISILGKGHSGVVLLARLDHKITALKIRRSDSVRSTMQAEANLLRLANGVGVGPNLVKFNDNAIAMKYLDGFGIGEWILNMVNDAQSLKYVIRNTLESCFRLDCLGLDHGELTDISRHVVVGDNNIIPTLIDFESGSLCRRVSNVTSGAQSMFVNSALASKIHTIYDSPSPSVLIPELRVYKHNPSYETFQGLLRVLGV